MKYLICMLIEGDVEKYHQNLIYIISQKFNTIGAVKRKPPTHITLKYSFEFENIRLIENHIKKFCQSNKKTQFKLKGFNHFENNVIFIEVLPSDNMKKTYHNFISSLKNKTDIQFKKFDGITHFHISVAHSDIKDNFDKIWSHVSKETVNYNLDFDNISILKLVNGVWEVHKKYQFNN